MTEYNLTVKQFLDRSDDIDYRDFSSKLKGKLEKLNKDLKFSHKLGDLKKEKTGQLNGLVFSAKDNICVKNVESTAGSKILKGYKPPFDATAVKRFKKAGGNFLCKTNQDEFGFGTFSTNSAYEVPKNPLDNKRVCGGSSGGAACLTKALDMPHIALSESTGGSISCPSAFCSVVGLTPTYGLVSRYGLIDYANSLDKIGPMGKSVYDVALGLSVIAGKDKRDQTSFGKVKDYTNLDGKLTGKVIGVPKEYFENVDKKIEKRIRNVISKMEDEGAKVKDVSLPNTKYALSSYYIIATSEASTNLSKLCGMRYGLHKDLKRNFDEYFSNVREEGFGEEAKRRIMLGTFARMSGYRDAYYLKALKVRTKIIEDFKRAFGDVDVLAAPTMPIMPPRFEDVEKLSPLEQYQMDVLTVPANLAGLPMINVPVKDMIGLHLIGDHKKEQNLLNIAKGVEDIL